MMHCSNRNSKKEKKTLRSLKFNPSVDSPRICTRKLDLLSKGDRLQNRKIYSAHVYRPPHMWCRRTYTQCDTVPLYRQCYQLGRIHCAFLFWQLLSLGGGCSLAWEDLQSERCNRFQSESQKVYQHNNTKYISTELLSVTTKHHLYKKIVKIFTPTEKHNI